MVKKIEQAILNQGQEFDSIEAALRGRGRHLEDTLRTKERGIESLSTNLPAKTVLTVTGQRQKEKAVNITRRITGLQAWLTQLVA